MVYGLYLYINERRILALLDSGATASFIQPEVVGKLGFNLNTLERGHKFKGIEGADFKVNMYAKRVKWYVIMNLPGTS